MGRLRLSRSRRDDIGLSCVDLGGDEHAADRFYLKDLTIRPMRPIWNIVYYETLLGKIDERNHVITGV